MKRLTLFLLTLSIAAFLAPRAEATNFVNYNTGDLLLGFWASSGNGASEDYLVDLGPVTQFENLAPGNSLTFTSSTTSAIGNIGGDLTATFGSGWNLDTSLDWAAAAATSVSDTAGTMYVSIGESTPGTIQPGWAANTKNTQLPPEGLIDASGDALKSDTSTALSTVAAVQQDSQTNSWESYMASSGNGDIAFSYFNGGIGGAFDNTAATNDDTPLDLYQLIPGTSVTKKSNYLGTFTIDPSGDVTFTNLQSVPEPATYAMLFWGVGAFVLLGRCRKSCIQS